MSPGFWLMINAHLSNPRQKKDPLRSFAISIWFLQKWGLTLPRYPFKNCRIDLLPSQHGWEKISNHKWGYVSCQTHSIHMYGIFTYIYHTNQPFHVGKSSNPTVFRKKQCISSTPGIGSCSALRLPAVYAWLKWMAWIIARTSAPQLDKQKGIGKELISAAKDAGITWKERQLLVCILNIQFVYDIYIIYIYVIMYIIIYIYMYIYIYLNMVLLSGDYDTQSFCVNDMYQIHNLLNLLGKSPGILEAPPLQP